MRACSVRPLTHPPKDWKEIKMDNSRSFISFLCRSPCLDMEGRLAPCNSSTINEVGISITNYVNSSLIRKLQPINTEFSHSKRVIYRILRSMILALLSIFFSQLKMVIALSKGKTPSWNLYFIYLYKGDRKKTRLFRRPIPYQSPLLLKKSILFFRQN